MEQSKAKPVWAKLSVTLGVLAAAGSAQAAPPAIGQWDGVTPSAHLATPYENPVESKIPFGIISYFLNPWRSYMDTWPAAHYLAFPGVNWNVDSKYAEPVATLLQESGITNVRYEIGWGNLNWNDEIPEDRKKRIESDLAVFKKHGIRPMMLLNAHHGVPCPIRDVAVDVVADEKKGDHILKLKPGTVLRVGYTGPNHPDYIETYPLITQLDADGTAHLSAGLGMDIKAGPTHLTELKYQPFQGDTFADGTPNPAAQETFDGWLKYAALVSKIAKEGLGTAGASDAGFDLELWNEQTFGSNFLRLSNYYDVKPQFKQYNMNGLKVDYLYEKTRPVLPTYRPDAQTSFKAADCYAILPMTIDYIAAHRSDYPGVRVVSGFANQWPWDSGTGLWPDQAGFSRHYYTGGWKDSSPENPLGTVGSGTVDALGKFDGQKDGGKEWHTIVPMTNFVPTFRVGMPEFLHTGMKTESLSRDVLPDSRYVYFPGHGRFTHNGDYKTAELWETEVNYDRSGIWDTIRKADPSIKNDDPKALALDEHIAARNMLRQYIFHNAKGLDRIYMFAIGANPYSLGMFPQRLYDAIDAGKGTLTPEARAAVPEGFAGMTWLAKQMQSGTPIESPRALRVADLVEYKPRLVFAGDGTPAHPSRYNRDNFAIMPYQLSPSKYVVPYYVVTVDQSFAWDPSKPLLDPAHWDMPAQDYDITFQNVRGTGATVADYDLLTNKMVPVKIVDAGSHWLTVHVSATDYPRALQITESVPGPQIVSPSVALTPDNHVKVTWKTNVPAAVTVTYGADWVNRSAQQVDLAAGTTSFTVPTVIKGVVAVRIKATANGLTDEWPHWDEDPQGQIVAPGGVAHPASPAPGAPSPLSEPAASAPFNAPASIKLGTPITSAEHGYKIALPAGVDISGPPDSREATLLGKAGPIALQIRYVAGGAADPEQYLPFTATGDDRTSSSVTLPAGGHAWLNDYTLLAAAHPGMQNLSQRWLIAPAGKDIIIVSVSGTPRAMTADHDRIQAVLASLQLP